MSALLIAALAAFVVEFAKSAGHEAGIRIVAEIGPHISPAAVGEVWKKLVEACERQVAGHPMAVTDFFASPEWSQPNPPPLDPDDPLYTR